MSTAMAVPELEQQALTLGDKARAIVVRDQVTHDAAAELYLGLSALEKEIGAVHDPAISAAHASHKAAIAAKAKLAAPVEEAKRIIKPKITAWEQEQERIRRELERKAQEAARKQEEEARLALAVQAEEMQAAPEVVQEILERPLPMTQPIVAPTFTKTKGFTSRENWSAQLTDIKVLCRAVADGKVADNLVLPNGPALNSLARGMKQAFNVPGVRAVKEIV